MELAAIALRRNLVTMQPFVERLLPKNPGAVKCRMLEVCFFPAILAHENQLSKMLVSFCAHLSLLLLAHRLGHGTRCDSTTLGHSWLDTLILTLVLCHNFGIWRNHRKISIWTDRTMKFQSISTMRFSFCQCVVPWMRNLRFRRGSEPQPGAQSQWHNGVMNLPAANMDYEVQAFNTMPSAPRMKSPGNKCWAPLLQNMWTKKNSSWHWRALPGCPLARGGHCWRSVTNFRRVQRTMVIEWSTIVVNQWLMMAGGQLYNVIKC